MKKEKEANKKVKLNHISEKPATPKKEKKITEKLTGKAKSRESVLKSGLLKKSDHGKAKNVTAQIVTKEAFQFEETRKKVKEPKAKVKIIPLGGVDGIGMNMTVIEYEEDILIIDCGMAFPREDMPGVDVIIPDFSYLIENENKIRGLVLTHGHEDHIGAVPYLLNKIDCDVYGTPLTLGILEGKLKEAEIKTNHLYEVHAGDVLKLGVFDVELIHVNHSMPDSVALSIATPCGKIVHTGDFKIDYTPIGTKPIDLARFAELGRKGVKLLLCESTNVERAGYTPSEKTLTASFDRLFGETKKRVVISTFASNVHRIQQILDASEKCGRKVAVTGRSILNVLKAAMNLGYIRAAEGLIIDIYDIKYYPPEQLTILTTGTQGEPMSALYRMAFGAHPLVTLGVNDTVILSSSCIPGNEKLVGKIINELYRHNVSVVTDRTDDVHVSGHACREELKLMHNLVNADCFVPIHGEYHHLAIHAQLAKEMGMKPEKVLIPETGKVIEMDKRGIRFGETVTAGQVMIDGGLGDGVESAVLRDRNLLAESGIVFVNAVLDPYYGLVIGPEIITRGFIFEKDNEELISYLTEMAKRSITKQFDKGNKDPVSIGTKLKDDMSNVIYQKTKRKPIVVTSVKNLE